MTVTAAQFVAKCMSQDGKRYIFGFEVAPSDTNPEAFDCSELLQWAGAQLDISPSIPDGSWYQAQHCRDKGRIIPVEEAIDTPGALLFRFNGDPWGRQRPESAHVAVSQGNGKTIEARSSRYGTGQFDAVGRGWTHAGLLPGVDYSTIVDWGTPIKDVLDPGGSPPPGRIAFWTVFDTGHVQAHNGARSTSPDLSAVALVEPVSGAELIRSARGDVLVLVARGDSGTFVLSLS